MRSIRSGTVDIHYLQKGTGPATLWIHGAGGNSAIWWQQLEYFSKNKKFIAYDHRSFGRSHCSMDDVTPEVLCEDATAVLDACGENSAALICQSLGGWTGIRLALQAPERVEKLVLSCTMAGINHPPAVAAVTKSRGKMDERGPASIAIGNVMADENPLKAYLYEQSGAFNTSFDPTKLGNLTGPDNMIPVSALMQIKCPVLLISGDNDAIWPAESLTGLIDAFPNARQEIISGSGHSPYFERPEAFNSIVDAFLRE